MSMVLNKEQIATQDAAKKLIQAHSPVSALRQLRDEKNEQGYDEFLWQQMIVLGWPAILIPEEFGGLELSPSFLSVILEESGRTLTCSPLWSSSLFATYLLVHSADSPARTKALNAMATGKHLVSVAMEEKARHAPYDINTRLTGDAELTLTGQKHFVINGHIADQFIVSACNAKNELMLVLVDQDQPGIIVERNWMVDSHNSATVTFDQVTVSADQMIKNNNLKALFDNALDVARLGLSAEMLGTATEAFERTLAYLKEREQFGAIIGSFQGLKHRAALMFSELELAKSTVREGFAALDNPNTDSTKLARLASIAKAQLSETLHLISNEAVQMHGGIGMTDEHEIGFFLKRARVLEQLLGDEVFHTDRFASISGY